MPSSTVLNLTDPHQYQSAVRGADLQVFITARGTFSAKLTRIDLHHVWMQRGHLSLSAVTRSAMRPQRSSIVFLADADQSPMLNNGNEVSPGDIVCYALQSEHHVRASGGYHCCAMSLTPDDLAAFGRALVGHELTAPPATRALRPPPALMSRLQALHRSASDLAATAPDILAHPEVAKARDQELIRAMVACLANPETEERYGSCRPRIPVMLRFEQILDAKADRPLYVADICAEMGVSDRTLRLHCQEQLGMSPHRYLWLRRMNLARRALAIAAATEKTVTAIANDHGFGELGRFAVAYRRLFGELPSVTLRRTPDDHRSANTRGTVGECWPDGKRRASRIF